MKTRKIPYTIHYSLFTIHKPLHGFTLVEVLIVVAILGILASVIIPEYRNYTQKAKESAAKESLQLLRTAIERYAIQHNETPPGYPEGNTSQAPDAITFIWQLVWHSDVSGRVSQTAAPGYIYGPYLKSWPYNPYNDSWAVTMIGNGQPMPVTAAGTNAYIYKPETKEIRLDWPGTDSTGIRYYDY